MKYNNVETKKNNIFVNVLGIISAGLLLFYLIFMWLHNRNWWSFLFIALYFAVFFFVSVIIHELGHMVFGLKSGYKFLYFQFLWFKIYKENGKIKFKIENNSLLGQCLLTIPDKPVNDIKYRSYMRGGSLFNLFVFILSFLGLMLVTFLQKSVSYSLSIFSFINFYFFISNYIPLNIGGIYNDGLNAKLMEEYDEVRFTIFNQLKVEEKLISGAKVNEIGLDLIRNNNIETDFNFVHNYAFHYLETIYRLVNDMDEPFGLIDKHYKNRNRLPYIYQKQNLELFLFHRLTANLQFQYLLNDKKNAAYYKKPDKKNPIQSLDLLLIEYKNQKIDKKEIDDKIKSISNLIETSSAEYEKELYFKLIEITLNYVNGTYPKKEDNFENTSTSQ